jgi:hypothetical protein
MSVNPITDLEQVKIAFKKFRAGRPEGSKARLPENLWAAAVALLDHYPFKQVWQELRLKPEYLKWRAGLESKQRAVAAPKEKSPKFLRLKANELTALNNGADQNIAAQSPSNQRSECRLVIERVDGSRLSLNLPCDWARIEGLCANFLRG